MSRKFDIDSTAPIVGRSNPNILCFFNSLRAALESCSSFNEVLETHHEHIPIFGKLYLKCIENNHQNSGIEDGGALAKIFVRILKQKGVEFGNQQEDASEGIDWFFHCLEDYKEVIKLFQFRYTREFYCGVCKQLSLTMNHCERQHKIFNMEEPTKSRDDGTHYAKFMYNLRGGINRYDKDYECTKCHEKKGGYTSDTLKLLPEVIIIQLGQFNRKSRLYFPFNFRFQKKGIDDYLYYKLVAQIEHFGTRSGGHYVARVLRKNPETDKPQVYHVNDDRVHRASFERTENTYILFYHLFEPTRNDPYNYDEEKTMRTV